MLNPYRYHAQPQQLMGYADATTKIPEFAWKAANTVAQKRKLEHVWAQYPEPWPPGEAAIGGDANYAYQYARQIIKKPWPPGEAAIAGDAAYAYRYARDVIGKRWPPGEAAIAGSAEAAYEYALDVIGKRWPPGEAAIASEAEWAKAYQEEFWVKIRA